MAIKNAREWIKTDLATRQQMIRDFYATNDPHLRNTFLNLIRAPKGYGIFASLGPRIQFAVFGRDSIEVAEDLLEINPQLAKEIIILLASLQGMTTDPTSEEEPGKIHHEYRRPSFNGHRISKVAHILLDELRKNWGHKTKNLLYYGTFDATPLFVRLVHRYVRIHGPTILSQEIKGKDGSIQPLRHHVHMATEWLAGKVVASSWGLFEDRRKNKSGIYNQEWQDSQEAYVHTDGQLANADAGVAAIELQGYAYDALLAAAELVATNDDESTMWRELAARIQQQTLKLLWMPKTKFFAIGLDRDPLHGKTRQIATLNANGALLLDSHLLSDLKPAEAKPYIDGIIATIMSDDFLTPAGLRIRALRYAHVVKYADYHGSLVSWPKETYDIAKGLRRNGKNVLASKLEDILLESIAQAGEFYEFFLIDREGRVKYHYRREDPEEPAFQAFSATVAPEAGQAWTISAIIAIVARRHSAEHPNS